jgi:DNA-binding beta-propeller fold protein YncE
MKKYLLGLAVLLMGTAVMTSCSDDNDGPETYLQEYSTGAYVVNSGNMYNKIESSLTAIDYASSTATQKVFKAANGRSLGNTANDGIVYGNKIYLAVDQSNTIEVIDKKTKQSIKQIKTTDLLGNAEGAEPRHIIADGGKVYFTTYGGYVAAVDTTSFALQKKWQVGSYPEGLVIGNGNLYVANSNYGKGGGNISCINLSNDKVDTKNIEGVNNPTGIYYAAGLLYVLDNQYYDASYNAYGENTLRTVEFAQGKSQKVADGNYAVCVTPGATTRTDVEKVRPYFFVLNAPFGGTPSVSVFVAGSTQPQALTLSEMPVSPCGIFADPLNGHVFVLSYRLGDSGYADYNGNGYVVEYDSTGQKLHEYETGVGSCAMFFDSAYKTAYAE